MSEIESLIRLLIEAFFECFNRGELSDSKFSEECKSDNHFKNVRGFMCFDYSCVSAELLLDNTFLDLQVVTWILEVFNRSLTSISIQDLSSKLSRFDESVSKDYFFRVIGNVPKSNNRLAFNLFRLIWDSAFNRVSCYEKSISYATALHNASEENLTNKYNTLQNSIEKAITSVDNIFEKVNGKGGQDGLERRVELASTSVNNIVEKINGKDGQDGLERKVDNVRDSIQNVRDSIQNTTVTILGIFAAIVLAFSGAFSFSSSVMQNIDGVSIYRLVGVIVLLGIVCFNLIFCLIIYLLRGSKISKDAFSIIKFYLPLLVTDIILLAILGLTIISWHFGWLEKPPSQDSTSIASMSWNDDVAQSDTETTNSYPLS